MTQEQFVTALLTVYNALQREYSYGDVHRLDVTVNDTSVGFTLTARGVSITGYKEVTA